jgi:hypothetical protein
LIDGRDGRRHQRKDMMAFKAPDFTERTAAARAAKQRALEKLRDKPAADPAVIAARQAAAAAREEAAAERRAERQREIAEAKAAKAAKAEAAALAAQAEAEANQKAPPPELSDAEKKAARDARYAARKARKR